MDLKEILWLSYKDLSEKKVRTALTIVMVIIGVAAIVALTSFTAGISQSINTSLSSLGPTSIIITSSSGTGFTIADTARLSTLPNVTVAVPVLMGQANLLAGNQNVSATLIGVTPQGIPQLLGGNLSLYQGTIYQDTITPAIIVGHSVAFPSTAAGEQTITVGQTATLEINGRTKKILTVPVVGILNSYGSFIVPIDTAVVVSLPAAEVLLNRNSFNEIILKTNSTESVNATAALITTIYGSSVRVITTQQLIQTTASIIGSISLLFAVIAGVSLLVAAIGIMNIMLIAVYERTHEIGILKSVGFKSKYILLIFLFQALIIGFVGGLLGIVMGAGASYGLSAVFGSGGSSSSTAASSSSARTGSNSGSTRSGSSGFGGGSSGGSSFGGGSSSGTTSLSFHPVFPISTIISALLVAMIVSVIAGIYPAWRASKMEPIDALRML